MLKKFGFFDEHTPDSAIKLLHTLQSEGPAENEPKVLAYLKSGTMLLASAGIATDLLSDNHDIIGPPHIFTDGEWCWTADTVYYIESYHISIPVELMRWMRSNEWQCPPIDNPKSLVEENWPI